MKQIEWINYLYNELTIESLNNNLYKFQNAKKIKSKSIKNNLILTKKKNNICKNNNLKNNKKTYIIEEEEIINFNNNNFLKKGIKTNKEIFRNKFKKNIINLIKAENGGIKSRNKEEVEKVNHNNLNKKEKKLKYLSKTNCNERKIFDNNRLNLFKIKKYSELTYANIHKCKKKYNKKNFFFSNIEKTFYIKNNALIERTLPEMYVLNNYGLLNDDDYEFGKKIIRCSSVKDKRVIKLKR